MVQGLRYIAQQLNGAFMLFLCLCFFTPFSSVLKICLSGAPIIYKYKYIHVCRGIISSDNLWTYRLGLHAHPSAQQLDDLETDDQ